MSLVYGWDVSTSIVGIACLDRSTGKLVSSSHLDLRKVDGLNEKALRVEQYAWKELPPGGIHFVEERLGGFSGGRTSAQVLMRLGAFNAIVQYILFTRGRGEGVRTIHPSTWKAAARREGLLIAKGVASDAKKQLTLEHVLRLEPAFSLELNKNGKPQPWMFDRADAWCVARAGWKQLQEEEQDGEAEEAGRAAEVPAERGPGIGQ